MTQINPLTGAIIQGMQVQPRQSAEKDRQIRRLQNLAKNSALQGDRLEHQVESADVLHGIDDGKDSHSQQNRSGAETETPEEEQTPRIDLTA